MFVISDGSRRGSIFFREVSRNFAVWEWTAAFKQDRRGAVPVSGVLTRIGMDSIEEKNMSMWFWRTLKIKEFTSIRIWSSVTVLR